MIEGVKAFKKMSIPSVMEELKAASEQVLDFFERITLDKTQNFDVRLCFEESFINAVKHGNKNQKELSVFVELAFNERELFIAVEDSGAGFDYRRLPDPTAGMNLESPKGRGVYLVRHLMDRVVFSARGNRVEMIKVYRKENKEKTI